MLYESWTLFLVALVLCLVIVGGGRLSTRYGIAAWIPLGVVLVLLIVLYALGVIHA